MAGKDVDASSRERSENYFANVGLAGFQRLAGSAKLLPEHESGRPVRRCLLLFLPKLVMQARAMMPPKRHAPCKNHFVQLCVDLT